MSAKPPLLNQDGLPACGLGTPAIKLLDFGLAKQVDGHPQDQPVTRLGVMLGTPAYVSPEQAAGEPIDARSDLYSLGVVLFEMVCGKTPFQDRGAGAALMRAHITMPPPRPRDLEPALSPALEAVILKALEKEPAARLARAEEFQAALATCPEAKRDSGAQSAAAVTPSPPARAAAATARSRSSWGLLGGAGLLLLGGIGVGLMLHRGAPSPASSATPAVQGPPVSKTPAPAPLPEPKKAAPPPDAVADAAGMPTALTALPMQPKSPPPTDATEASTAHEPTAIALRPSAPPPATSPPVLPTSKAAQRALSLVDQGRAKAAIDAARAALRRNPKDTMARLALGAAYQGNLWCSDAIEEFERVVREVPALGSEPRLLRSSITCLKSKVQNKVVRFLAKLGQPARGPLEHAATSSDPELRQGAKRALARLK